MKVKVEKGGPCRKTLVVDLPADVVDAEYAKMVDEYARFARIPGFRPGKTPRNLVESHFAKEIREELKNRLISRSYPDAVKQAELNPLMILDVKAEVELHKPMNIRVTLDVPPEFKLPKYKNIPVAPKPVQVSDEEVQKALARLLEYHVKYETVADRPVCRNDVAQIDYARKEPAVQKPAAEKNKNKKMRDYLAAGTDYWMNVSEHGDLLPGFGPSLEGMTIGSRKDITLAIPADFNIPELAGKQVVYGVTLKALREKKLPELTADFLKSIGVESEAALRDKMRSSLLDEENRREKERQKNEVVEYLLKHTSIDLPESLVQDETRHMYATIARQQLMRGSTREQLESRREELLSTAAKTAGEKVKLGYILHKVGEEEKITAEDAEVESRIQILARQYRMAPDALRKELLEKDEMDAVKHEVRMDKILDFLLANSVAEEKGLINRLFKGGSKQA